MPSVQSLERPSTRANRSNPVPTSAERDDTLVRVIVAASGQRLSSVQARIAVAALRVGFEQATAGQQEARPVLDRVLRLVNERCPGVFCRLAALTVAEALMRDAYGARAGRR